MTSDSPESAPEAPARSQSWFGRMPLWARIAVPIALAAVIVAVVAVVAWQPPQDPVDEAQSLCRSAVEAEVESSDRSDVRVSQSFEVIEQAGGAYRVSGTVTFVDDEGSTHQASARCIVRDEGSRLRVTGVRWQD